MLRVSKKKSQFDYFIFAYNKNAEEYEQYECEDLEECQECLDQFTKEDVPAFILVSHHSMEDKIASVLLDKDYGFKT